MNNNINIYYEIFYSNEIIERIYFLKNNIIKWNKFNYDNFP